MILSYLSFCLSACRIASVFLNHPYIHFPSPSPVVLRNIFPLGFSFPPHLLLSHLHTDSLQMQFHASSVFTLCDHLSVLIMPSDLKIKIHLNSTLLRATTKKQKPVQLLWFLSTASDEDRVLQPSLVLFIFPTPKSRPQQNIRNASVSVPLPQSCHYSLVQAPIISFLGLLCIFHFLFIIFCTCRPSKSF